jgi:hypothetical protein
MELAGWLCRSKTEREVRALTQWPKIVDLCGGRFVWLLANTVNERTWIIRKFEDAASTEHAVSSGADNADGLYTAEVEAR